VVSEEKQLNNFYPIHTANLKQKTNYDFQLTIIFLLFAGKGKTPSS
jgi:hypothetical protein